MFRGKFIMSPFKIEARARVRVRGVRVGVRVRG